MHEIVVVRRHLYVINFTKSTAMSKFGPIMSRTWNVDVRHYVEKCSFRSHLVVTYIFIVDNKTRRQIVSGNVFFSNKVITMQIDTTEFEKEVRELGFIFLRFFYGHVVSNILVTFLHVVT